MIGQLSLERRFSASNHLPNQPRDLPSSLAWPLLDDLFSVFRFPFSVGNHEE
jgi:hypothetical protein